MTTTVPPASTPVPAGMPPLSKIPEFDPRHAPVIGVDTQLPPVPAAAQTPAALRQRFAKPPVWEPEVLREARFAQRAPADAAVLVPIVLRDRPTVLLTERTTHLSTHSGQVAFPGGKTDPEDAGPADTALREAWEEVGLEARSVEVLGTLPVYVTGTSFMVTPVVALVQPDSALRPNPYEVADVFEVPLDFLLDPANHRRHAMEWQGHRREWFSMPFQESGPDGKTRFIWGATAGMLRNFYRFMMA